MRQRRGVFVSAGNVFLRSLPNGEPLLFLIHIAGHGIILVRKISDIRRERVELYVYISMIFNIAMSIAKFLAYILIIICAVKYLKKQE